MELYPPPFLIPLLAAGVIALFVGVAAAIVRAGNFNKIQTYRRRYLDLVNRIDKLACTLKEVGDRHWIPSEEKPLILFHELVQRFEQLLELMAKVKPFGKEIQIICSAEGATLQFEKRLAQVFDSVGNPKKSTAASGITFFGLACYFCSRPFVDSGLKRTKVRFEDKMLKVLGCDHCREKLANNHRIKILYFLVDGDPKHWSEVATYNPVTDFRDVNQPAPNNKFRQRKLELVFSDD